MFFLFELFTMTMFCLFMFFSERPAKPFWETSKCTTTVRVCQQSLREDAQSVGAKLGAAQLKAPGRGVRLASDTVPAPRRRHRRGAPTQSRGTRQAEFGEELEQVLVS
jgi:hypothetical protein